MDVRHIFFKLTQPVDINETHVYFWRTLNLNNVDSEMVRFVLILFDQRHTKPEYELSPHDVMILLMFLTDILNRYIPLYEAKDRFPLENVIYGLYRALCAIKPRELLQYDLSKDDPDYKVTDEAIDVIENKIKKICTINTRAPFDEFIRLLQVQKLRGITTFTFKCVIQCILSQLGRMKRLRQDKEWNAKAEIYRIEVGRSDQTDDVMLIQKVEFVVDNQNATSSFHYTRTRSEENVEDLLGEIWLAREAPNLITEDNFLNSLRSAYTNFLIRIWNYRVEGAFPDHIVMSVIDFTIGAMDLLGKANQLQKFDTAMFLMHILKNLRLMWDKITRKNILTSCYRIDILYMLHDFLRSLINLNRDVECMPEPMYLDFLNVGKDMNILAEENYTGKICFNFSDRRTINFDLMGNVTYEFDVMKLNDLRECTIAKWMKKLEDYPTLDSLLIMNESNNCINCNRNLHEVKACILLNCFHIHCVECAKTMMDRRTDTFTCMQCQTEALDCVEGSSINLMRSLFSANFSLPEE